MAQTTTADKTAMLEKFTDNTAGETYSRGRLATRETDNGNVALIAYGWLKLAEYNERRDAVTLFTGHRSIGSQTVSRYLNEVREIASDRRNVVLSGESPTVGTPNEGVRFIGNYVNFDGPMSSVEKKAVDTVIDSLDRVL